MAVETQKSVFKWLGKVAMSHKLLVFEVMNEKRLVSILILKISESEKWWILSII